MYLMNANGVWEASQKTLILIVGLHEEVKIFPWLQSKKIHRGGKKKLP